MSKSDCLSGYLMLRISAEEPKLLLLLRLLLVMVVLVLLVVLLLELVYLSFMKTHKQATTLEKQH